MFAEREHSLVLFYNSKLKCKVSLYVSRQIISAAIFHLDMYANLNSCQCFKLGHFTNYFAFFAFLFSVIMNHDFVTRIIMSI